MTGTTTGTVLFLREFLRSPLRTASLLPSSAQLVEAVLVRGEPVLVELDSGTGPATAAIQHRLGGRGHHAAIELSDQLAVHLSSCRGNFPRQVGLVVRTSCDKTTGRRSRAPWGQLGWFEAGVGGCVRLVAGTSRDRWVMSCELPATRRSPSTEGDGVHQ